jgi:outer membrane protein assembly factor BamB
MVYAASEGVDGVLMGIDMYSGKRRWQTRTGGVDAPILLHDHSVYAVTSRGVAVAHRASDGRQRWRRATGPSRTGPLAAGPWIAFVTVTDTLFVLDTASGAVRARKALPSGSAAPLALLDDSTVVVSSPGGSIMAVALPSGTVRWEVPTTAPVYGTPVVSGDTVFALTSHCTLWTIPSGAPAEADTAALGCGPTLAAPLLVRGGVVVASVGGELLYYDRLRRRRVWTQATGGELRHPPALRNGQLVVAPIIGDVLSFR